MGKLLIIDIPGHAYFVTTRVARGLRLFVDDIYNEIIINNFIFYRKAKCFKLLGYVIMPDHLHYIILPVGQYTISDILRDFKKQTSKDILRRLKKDKRAGRILNPTCGNTSGIKNPASPAWARRLLGLFFKNSIKQEYQVWQSRNWTVNIYSEKFFHRKLGYIHQNPVKAGLVKNAVDYKYSSARNYYLGDYSVIKIDNE